MYIDIKTLAREIWEGSPEGIPQGLKSKRELRIGDDEGLPPSEQIVEVLPIPAVTGGAKRDLGEENLIFVVHLCLDRPGQIVFLTELVSFLDAVLSIVKILGAHGGSFRVVGDHQFADLKITCFVRFVKSTARKTAVSLWGARAKKVKIDEKKRAHHWGGKGGGKAAEMGMLPHPDTTARESLPLGGQPKGALQLSYCIRTSVQRLWVFSLTNGFG